MEGQKFWHVKEVRAANVRQAKRYAERWCAARLYPDLPLREAGARLTDNTPIQPPSPMPGLPPTREQLQRVKEALEPRKQPVATKPRARDPQKARVRAALQQLRRGV